MPTKKMGFTILKQKSIMKIKCTLLLGLICFATNLLAQSNEDLIKTYKETCKKYANNADTLFHYSALFLKLEDSTAQYEGHFAKAYAFRNTMVIDSALSNFQEALKFAQQDDLKSRAIRMSVITATNAGKNDLALSFCQEMFDLARDISDSLLLAHSYNQRGIIYKEMGNLEHAIEDYIKASRIYETIKTPEIVNTYTNIAIAYNILGQDTIALDWFKTAYKNAKKYEIPGLEIRATNNLANHFKTLKDYDSSEAYYNQLLKREDELNLFYKTLLYQSLSELSVYKTDYNKARTYLNLVKPLILSGTNVERKIQIHSQSAKLENALENYNKSLIQLDSAIFIAKQYKLPNRLFPLYLRKAEIHKTLEQYRPATDYYQLYTSLRDSLQNLQDMEIIQESIAKYELDRREQAMKNFIAKEKGLKSNLLMISLVSFLLLITSFIIYRRYTSTKAKHKTTLELANQRTSELDKLKKQLKQQNTNHKIRLKTNKIVNCNDLVYIKSDGHYLEYYLENRKAPIIERQTFSNVITQLKTCGFVRVHRSYVINTQKVESVNTFTLQLQQSVEIPFSRTYRNKLKEENHPLLS